MAYNVKGLKIHRYAPELNALHLMDGRVINCAGCTTIKDAVAHLTELGIPEQKPPSLIERVEKAIQDLGHETGAIIEIARGTVKVFTIEILDIVGEPDTTWTIIVNPDNDIANIMEISNVIELC